METCTFCLSNEAANYLSNDNLDQILKDRGPAYIRWERTPNCVKIEYPNELLLKHAMGRLCGYCTRGDIEYKDLIMLSGSWYKGGINDDL